MGTEQIVLYSDCGTPGELLLLLVWTLVSECFLEGYGITLKTFVKMYKGSFTFR